MEDELLESQQAIVFEGGELWAKSIKRKKASRNK